MRVHTCWSGVKHMHTRKAMPDTSEATAVIMHRSGHAELSAWYGTRSAWSPIALLGVCLPIPPDHFASDCLQAPCRFQPQHPLPPSLLSVQYAPRCAMTCWAAHRQTLPQQPQRVLQQQRRHQQTGPRKTTMASSSHDPEHGSAML